MVFILLLRYVFDKGIESAPWIIELLLAGVGGGSLFGNCDTC